MGERANRRIRIPMRFSPKFITRSRGVGRDEKHSFLRVEGKGGKENSCGVLAAGLESSEGMAGALCHAESILEGVLRDAPAIGAKKVA